jgi:hypothetical protein
MFSALWSVLKGQGNAAAHQTKVLIGKRQIESPIVRGDINAGHDEVS